MCFYLEANDEEQLTISDMSNKMKEFLYRQSVNPLQKSVSQAEIIGTIRRLNIDCGKWKYPWYCDMREKTS